MFKPDTLKRNVVGFIGAFLLSFTAMAEEAALATNHPDTYVVKKGDTLWDISGKFLEKPWQWPKIWHANPEIANPDLIYPGDTLRLVYVDGKPQIILSRGDAGGTVKMSPCPAGKLCPTVRVEPLESPIPAIPLDVINPFLSGTRVVEPGTLEAAPYVLMGTQKHVVTGAGDSVNARGEFDPKVPVYGMFRKGKTYTDEETGEVLGVQAIDIGSAKVTNSERDVVVMNVLRSTREVLAGDRLLASEERAINAIFYPSPPETDIEGNIIDVEGGVNQIGPMNVVLVDKGEREGLKVGNVLAIYQKGEKVRDPVTGETVSLINERAGLLMIFNVFEKTSFGLVLQADRPLAVGEMVKKP
jgi:nucleoid-associated protein YgaU